MENELEVEYIDSFPDVTDGAWYTDAIMWASQIGIVNGYTDTGLFGTGDKINREQVAVMMYRYEKYKGFDNSEKAELEFIVLMHLPKKQWNVQRLLCALLKNTRCN